MTSFARASARLLTVALGGLAFLVSAAVQAQAVPQAGQVRAAALQPIAVNTALWSSAGLGSGPPSWYRDKSGVIHLQGAVTKAGLAGPAGDLIGTLPPAARPATQVSAPVQAFTGGTLAGAYADIIIDPLTGHIFLDQANFAAAQSITFLSLEGISYSLSHPAAPIPLNAASFTSYIQDGNASWFKDRSGVVHLQGSIYQVAGGPPSNLVGTLPPAARPARTVYTIVSCSGGTYADLAILPDGQIQLIAPRPPAFTDFFAFSLPDISYRPAGRAQPLTVNFHNWTPGAGYGSRGPGWYQDRSGVVHLQGAVEQFNAGGLTAGLITTLPPAACPARTVYAIVHTFNGTFATLAIEPSGRIWIFAPAAPMVSDFTFVSLESVTYQR